MSETQEVQHVETEADLRSLSSAEVSRRLGAMIEPMSGKLAVQVSDVQEKTKAGLYLLPGAAKGTEKPTRGTVVALPKEDYEDENGNAVPGPFSIGDVVMFGKFSGVELTYGRERVYVMNEDEVLCKLRDPNATVRLR